MTLSKLDFYEHGIIFSWFYFLISAKGLQESQLMLEALNGFLIFVSKKGTIKFVSNTITDHLGLKQVGTNSVLSSCCQCWGFNGTPDWGSTWPKTRFGLLTIEYIQGYSWTMKASCYLFRFWKLACQWLLKACWDMTDCLFLIGMLFVQYTVSQVDPFCPKKLLSSILLAA